MTRLSQLCVVCILVGCMISPSWGVPLTFYGFDGAPVNPGGAGTPPSAPPTTVDPQVFATDMNIVAGTGGLTVLNTFQRDGVVGSGANHQYSFQQGIVANASVVPSDYHTFSFVVGPSGSIPIELVSLSLLSGHNNVDNTSTYQSIVELRDISNNLILSQTFNTTFGLALSPSGVIPLGLTITQPTTVNIRLNQQVIGPDSFTTQFRIDDVLLEGVVPEPTTLSLLAIGGLALLRRRRA